MIREILIDFREGDDDNARRVFAAIMKEINTITFEQLHPDKALNTKEEDLPTYPGKVIINVFDENEELIKVVET